MNIIPQFVLEKQWPIWIVFGLIVVLLVVLSLTGVWNAAIAVAGLAAVLMIVDQRLSTFIQIAALIVAALAGTLLSGELLAHLGDLALILVLLMTGFILRVRQLESTEVTQQLVPHISIDELAIRVESTVDGMVKSAQAIQTTTSDQSTGALEQVEVLQMATGRLESYLEMVEDTTTNATHISRRAQEVANIANDGQRALQQAMYRMEQIGQQVTAIGETILKLAQLTQRIDQIITALGEIATQSNLLALNASIEAARAGQHGRGFAVVADEVRALSQQSTESARQVRSILLEIQSVVKETIDATESGLRESSAGSRVTEDANQRLLHLTNTVSESYTTISSISDLVRKQANEMEEIVVDMERVNTITQQNLVSTRMVEQISRNLMRLAEDLQLALLESQHGNPAVPEDVVTEPTG